MNVRNQNFKPNECSSTTCFLTLRNFFDHKPNKVFSMHTMSRNILIRPKEKKKSALLASSLALSIKHHSTLLRKLLVVSNKRNQSRNLLLSIKRNASQRISRRIKFFLNIPEPNRNMKLIELRNQGVQLLK